MSTGFYLLAIEIICILRQPYLLYFFGLLLLSWQNKRRSQKPYFLFHRALFFREEGFPVSALFFYFYFYFFLLPLYTHPPPRPFLYPVDCRGTPF